MKKNMYIRDALVVRDVSHFLLYATVVIHSHWRAGVNRPSRIIILQAQKSFFDIIICCWYGKSVASLATICGTGSA